MPFLVSHFQLTFDIFLLLQSEKSQPRHNDHGAFTTLSRAVDLQQSRSGALLLQIGMLCAAGEAHNNAVLVRLGQQRPIGSTSFPKPDSSIKDWKIKSTYYEEEEESYFKATWSEALLSALSVALQLSLGTSLSSQVQMIKLRCLPLVDPLHFLYFIHVPGGECSVSQ